MPPAGDAALDALFADEAVRARLVPIPGARNLRDMGGYPAENGRRVKRGMLFRSGHPGDVAACDSAAWRTLGLGGHVDLRTNDERAATAFPDDLVAASGRWARDHRHSGGDFMAVLTSPAMTGDAMRARMIALYRDFPDEQHEGIAATFRLLLAGHLPFLVNCTAGKDRTGVVCALLLSALGVPRAVVRRDYALTEALHDPADALFSAAADSPFAAQASIKPEVWRAMMRSDPAYLDAMFEAIDRRHGGIDDYLADRMGLAADDLARLRDLLLED